MQLPYRISLTRSPSSIRLVKHGSSAHDAAGQSAAHQQTVADSRVANEALSEQLIYLQQMLNDVGSAIDELQQQHRETLAEMQQATVELAVTAASWVVGAAIDANVFAVDDLVESMLKQLRQEQPVRICLNPQDAELLQQLRDGADADRFSGTDMDIVADSELERGHCRAESARTTLVTDIEDQLADIRRIWMENLDETQIERRADDPAGRGFRRFPDRRHTA